MLTPTIVALAVLLAPSPAGQTAAAPAQAPTPEAKPTPDGPVIAFETTMGTIQVGLYATKAPLSTRNMVSYVKSGHYNGTIFHRVIPGFMIQGGGLDSKLVEKPTAPPIRNEARNGLLNTRGSLAFARTGDPHSATSQFFINVKDNPGLDFGISRDGWGYAVFGEVLSGMEVVDAIRNVPTSPIGPHEAVPVTPVVITKARIVSDPQAAAAPAAPKVGAPAAPRPAPGRPGAAAPKPAPKASPSASPTAKPKA